MKNILTIRPADQNVKSVVVTGSFDDWSQRDGVLTRDHLSEPFTKLVKLPSKEKITFKFVIDDTNWITSENFKSETDEHGNQNNYIDAHDLITVEELVELFQEEKVEKAEEKAENDKETIGNTNGEEEKYDEEDKCANDDELFTRVLTSESSYASVSLVSGESAFEHVSRDSGEASNRNAPEELTPTNSVGEERSERKATRPQLSDSEVTTIGPSSRNNSFSGGFQTAAEGDTISKSTKTNLLRDMETGKRKDGLMTRLRGLFRS